MGRWRLNSRGSALSKRAELTAFSCLVKKVIGLTNMHVDNKGEHSWAVDRRDEMCCPESERCGFVNQKLEELDSVPSKEMLIEVEHVKAHRTETETAHVAL